MKTAASKPKVLLLSRAAGLLLTLLPGLALAANGLTLTGFGSASAGMAGVDIAVSKDTTALNSNPAGLAQLNTQAMDIYLQPFYTLDNAHDDIYNNKQDINNRAGALFGGGYSRPFHDGEFVAGIAVFSQGGVGYVYKDLNTQFGTRDEISAIFGIFKLTPGLAWRVNDRLRVGAALGINYAVARQKFFFDTSFYDPKKPKEAFFGSRLDGLTGMGFNGKFGVQYLPSENLTLALAYTSKIPLNLDHGRTTVNYEAIGLDRVQYRDASLHGLALPQELGVGATYRLSPRCLIGAEFNWMDYSKAIKALTLKASDPDDSNAPADIFSRQTLNFRDVYVYAAAVEHQLNPKTVLRAGFSHSNIVVPSENLSPTLPLISENLLTVGFSTDLSPRWILGMALEHQLRNEVTYTNPVLPFGADAKEINQAFLLTVMLGQRW